MPTATPLNAGMDAQELHSKTVHLLLSHQECHVMPLERMLFVAKKYWAIMQGNHMTYMAVIKVKTSHASKQKKI